MDLQTLLEGFLGFLTGTVIPFLLVIATLMFVWNMTRYFIFGSTKAGNKEKHTASGRETARKYALWSIFAFVFIVSLWGIVTIIVNGLGLDNRSIAPDYMCENGLKGNCRK
jgi:hypothetical protein